MSFYKIIANFLILWTLMSCCTLNIINTGFVPKYRGVDPEVASYVDQWMSMAKERKIKFDDTVSIGFEIITKSATVGICTYGIGFREIDLDKVYWITSTKTIKMAVVWHELSHCYCGRGHDYIIGSEVKKYGDDESSRKDPEKKDGFYNDSCPVSLMFPVLPGDVCVLTHYVEYVDEMFKNCEPW